MKTAIPGVTIGEVSWKGHMVPAVVVNDSRKNQWFGLMAGVVLCVACYFMYGDAENVDLPIVGHSPQLARIFAVFGCVFFAIVFLTMLLQLLKPRGYLAITREGVTSTHFKPQIFLPWGEIQDAAAFYDGQRDAIGVRLIAPENSNLPEEHRQMMRRIHDRFGYDWGLVANLFDTPPALLEALLKFFLHQVEARAAIGAPEQLKEVKSYADQLASRKAPLPEMTPQNNVINNLFDPNEHKELFDEGLQKAIEDVARNDTPLNRKHLYELMLKATFCVATSAKDGDSQTVSGVLLESGEMALVAFTDPPALRRWQELPESMLVMTIPALCQMALENNFAEIHINPAGPVGGNLTRPEMTALAQSQIPE